MLLFDAYGANCAIMRQLLSQVLNFTILIYYGKKRTFV